MKLVRLWFLCCTSIFQKCPRTTRVFFEMSYITSMSLVWRLCEPPPTNCSFVQTMLDARKRVITRSVAIHPMLSCQLKHGTNHFCVTFMRISSLAKRCSASTSNVGLTNHGYYSNHLLAGIIIREPPELQITVDLSLPKRPGSYQHC